MQGNPSVPLWLAEAVLAALHTKQPDIIGFRVTNLDEFFLVLPSGESMEAAEFVKGTDTKELMGWLFAGLPEVTEPSGVFTYLRQ